MSNEPKRPETKRARERRLRSEARQEALSKAYLILNRLSKFAKKPDFDKDQNQLYRETFGYLACFVQARQEHFDRWMRFIQEHSIEMSPKKP